MAGFVICDALLKPRRNSQASIAVIGGKAHLLTGRKARELQPDNGDDSTFWSSTKDKTPVENAYGHSTKHGAGFPGYQNSVQYVQAAQDLVNNPPEGTLIKTRPNSNTLYYDPATNTFASRTKNGAPKTMFKPAAGMVYWNKKWCRKRKISYPAHTAST